MAKTTGPLFSLEASGTVADTLTYSRWKGRPYVRQRVIPSNPKSVLQVSVRGMMTYLSQAWAALSANNKATWQDAADAITASTFNAYVRENMRRWSNFEAPGQASPIGSTGGTAGDIAAALTGGVGQVTIDVTGSTDADIWGVGIFRGATGFTPARDNFIGVVPYLTSVGSASFVDSPLTPDTYFYNFRPFSDDGAMLTALGEDSAVVT
jgi:hypothetical protein